MAYPYTPPAFLQGQSADEIHQRMMNALPIDIDKGEGQIPWDFTRPSALEKAEFVEFELNETIKIMFPQWAYDEWLDLHAEQQGITRRAANKATGYVTVHAAPGTAIPSGFLFATPASQTPSILFETLEDITITGEPNEKGLVAFDMQIQAVEGGKSGNVPADSVKLMVKPLSGISFITNREATSGGAPEESDDELRERVLDTAQRGISYVGCDADYIRWAKEVPAVGQAIVQPEWNDPNLPPEYHYIEDGETKCAGAVRLIIIDSNGEPANQQILDAVYNHIISPQNRIARLAPIGAHVTVAPPSPVRIDISALVIYDEGENPETVKARFMENLKSYWITAAEEGSVKYVSIGARLEETRGIANYSAKSLTVNGGKNDIPIAVGEFPVLGEVNLE